jgi:hypothetical protein
MSSSADLKKYWLGASVGTFSDSSVAARNSFIVAAWTSHPLRHFPTPMTPMPLIVFWTRVRSDSSLTADWVELGCSAARVLGEGATSWPDSRDEQPLRVATDPMAREPVKTNFN